MEQQNPKPRTKYGNIMEDVATEGAVIRFDSRKEANRYRELIELQKASQISNLRLQVHYTLQGAFMTPKGEKVKGIEYIADFTYTTKDGEFVIEDVKSDSTKKNPVYRMKRKMMMAQGHRITEV
jgi:hypothetical protein